MDFVQMHYGADNQLLIDGATATISNSKFNHSERGCDPHPERRSNADGGEL